MRLGHSKLLEHKFTMIIPIAARAKFSLSILFCMSLLLTAPAHCAPEVTADTVQTSEQQTIEASSAATLTTDKKSTDKKSADANQAEVAQVPVVAQAPVKAQSNKVSGYPVNQPGTGAQLLSVTLALVFIVALIFAVSWFIRRFGSGAFVQAGQMKIVAALPLGTRERLMLVDVAGKQLLLGVTATQINCLHEFAEPVITGEAAGSSDFSRKLMAILQQKPLGGADSSASERGKGA